jgi:hypothetical protein
MRKKIYITKDEIKKYNKDRVYVWRMKNTNIYKIRDIILKLEYKISLLSKKIQKINNKKDKIMNVVKKIEDKKDKIMNVVKKIEDKKDKILKEYHKKIASTNSVKINQKDVDEYNNKIITENNQI